MAELAEAPIRRVKPEDAALLRETRLRALQESPAAFGTSYAEEYERPDEWWERWSSGASAGSDEALFFAEPDGDVQGIAAGYRAEGSSRVHLISMWVDPSHRRTDLGRALGEAVVEWAEATEAAETSLWVVDGNSPARRLYESMGFVDTGDSQPLLTNPSLIEHRMVKRLGG